MKPPRFSSSLSVYYIFTEDTMNKFCTQNEIQTDQQAKVESENPVLTILKIFCANRLFCTDQKPYQTRSLDLESYNYRFVFLSTSTVMKTQNPIPIRFR